MQIDEIRTLFAYDAWATGKILDQAAQLTAEQFTAPAGANGQSVGQVLAHLLIAQHLWRVRFETGTSELRLRPDAFSTPAALRDGWREERRALDAYFATLDDAALARPVRYERRGEMRAYTLWHILLQLLNHNTQHRAEVAEWLTTFGHSPGDLDFFLFIAPVE